MLLGFHRKGAAFAGCWSLEHMEFFFFFFNLGELDN
jgi:hypothetical protein